MSDLRSVFAALSDETRFDIVERLMKDGELPAGDLVSDSTISGPAISRHLKVLREAGLVEQRAEGTRRLYAVRPQALKTISDWTIDHRAFWEVSLNRMAAALEAEEDICPTSD
ncbi:ArsR/SmtB family transcription factor [Cognatishimia activa]|uniref:HTH-type transcriptional regulator n=1 Tax=Cognatishimia activa TaxID=1715691 RepID=A0A0P1IM28_9RHOB|nr:metalloregulator ArsR/SmtB family transcription factor [Cognatishimia activa]CUI45131.1 HTH-type transcriptional regulator [Cognatishimia activa]CUK24675.1 HTH-type transcriptional regulator [Cognatishimia activa]